MNIVTRWLSSFQFRLAPGVERMPQAPAATARRKTAGPSIKAGAAGQPAGRTRALTRRLGAMMLGGAMLAAPAAAQFTEDELTSVPPEDPAIGAGGADLVTGRYNATSPAVVIGTPGQGGLAYVWQHIHDESRHSMMGGVATTTPGEYVLSVMGQSWGFTLPAGVPTLDREDGSTLTRVVGVSFTLTMRDGTIAYFRNLVPGAEPMHGFDVAYLDYVLFPDGRRLDFNYTSAQFTETLYGPEPGCEPTGMPLDPCQEITASYGPYYRLQSVTTNQGYMLHFQYGRATATQASHVAAWIRLDKVTGLNNAVDYCAPFSNACSFSRTWPDLDITRPASNQIAFTDALGAATRWTLDGANRITGIKPPESSTDVVTVAYNGQDRVSSINAGGLTTSYSYSDVSGVRTTTVTGPGGASTAVKTEAVLSTGLIRASIDAQNRRTEYLYDSEARLTRVTFPEDNQIRYTYDARGNVTETRRVAKPGSGLADIVTSASYPASCSNAKTCNQPTTTTDAAGQTTSYTYDATHGGVRTITAPRPAVGADRPQTEITYWSRYAYFKNSSGAIVQAPSAVWLPRQTRQCRIGELSSCVGTINERRTQLTYGSNGVANNLAVSQVELMRGNGSLTQSTTLSYDANGDVEWMDPPEEGSANRVFMRYDVLRRQIGEIGPDPDAGGPRVRAATRITYDLNGRVITQETGTVTGTTTAAWNAFSRRQRQVVAYDSLGRITEARGYAAGSTIEALIQNSYYTSGTSRGLLRCTAQRMNPSTFASPPASACTLGTAGSYGPDRITEHVYDVHGRITRTTQGVGTSAAGDAARYSYTTNGLIDQITDGEGNILDHQYDGFDRLVEINYANKTGGGVNWADDEIFTYDSAGRLSTRRTRSNQLFTYTYDALSRVTHVTAPSGTDSTSVTYDNFSNILTVSGGGRTLTNSWDSLGRMLSQTGPNGTISYEYDGANRRTRMTWADGFYVTYSYNDASQLTHIRENGATSGVGVLAAFSYDDLGRRTALNYGNGTVTSYDYDALGRLDQLVQNLAGTAHDNTDTFAHNPAGQITSRSRTNTVYSYASHINVDTLFTHNGLNQITSVTGSTAPSYDGRGNMTSDGSTSFGFDQYNRLTSASGGVTLDYDPAGRLYEYVDTSTTRRFQYDGAALITEFNTSGSIQRRYVHGPGMDEPLVEYVGAGTTNRTFLHADARGSIVARTNSAGAVTSTLSYDEYGNPAATNTGRFMYTGQIWLRDAGVYHYKNRAYHPGLMRFLQTDPIGVAGGINLYAYVGGDPINFTDPMGLSPEPCPPGGDCIPVIGKRIPSRQPAVEPIWNFGWRANLINPKDFLPELELSALDASQGEEHCPSSGPLQQIAYVPEGETIGGSPQRSGNRYVTDLQGGYAEALALFTALSALNDQAYPDSPGLGDMLRSGVLDTTIMISSNPHTGARGAIRLRYGPDFRNPLEGQWKVDVQRGANPMLDAAETVHFRRSSSHESPICPTP